MMNRTITALACAAAVAGLAACSSSSSSTATGKTTSRPAATTSASTRPATLSGTERFSGVVRGAAVVANNSPTYPLTFTGPVATTGTFTPPNTNATHQTGVFRTGAGNMAVTAVVHGTNQQPQPAGANCLYKIPITAVYTVDGAKSTGRFAGATGHGTANVAVEFRLPKLTNGHCNLSQKAKPLTDGAISTFTASGPLTVKE